MTGEMNLTPAIASSTIRLIHYSVVFPSSKITYSILVHVSPIKRKKAYAESRGVAVETKILTILNAFLSRVCVSKFA